jgi:hypothetical protein
MSKCKKCWQTGQAFKLMKQQALLEQTIEDATNIAKKDGFTGFIHIYKRDKSLGFTYYKEGDASRPKRRPYQYLYFIDGASA